MGGEGQLVKSLEIEGKGQNVGEKELGLGPHS